MEMQPVESSNVAEIGHDPETQKLHIRFKDGSLHEYSDVPAETHEELMMADSKGRYVHENLKDRFDHARIE